MAISLVFSLGLYRVTSQEVVRGIRRQDGPIGALMRNQDRFPQAVINEILMSQEESIEDSLRKIKANLFLINVFIFVSGGLLSYYFARRTLAPIEKAHEAQSRFAADASHELRTPLTAMKLETELTLTEPKLSLKQAKEQLQSNLEELDKLTSLSENMLKLARLDNEHGAQERVNLETIITKAIERISPLSEQKKQSIKLECSPKINIHANESSLIEAFVTLLDNAVKYSPELSTIHIYSEADAKQVKIIIKDSGIGISGNDLPHIFERFYRADDSRTNSTVNGYGIGLSIAKSAIESLSGNISVESKPGKGSTFTVSLPLAN
jgi:two-component system OmpR family sensor kinase